MKRLIGLVLLMIALAGCVNTLCYDAARHQGWGRFNAAAWCYLPPQFGESLTTRVACVEDR
jgi:hypothetical protein